MATTKKSTSPAIDPRAIHSWLAVVRAYNLCEAVMTERLAALDVRLGEHEVLSNLLKTPGMTQQQLAEHCFVAKSGVSMLVTRMEQTGLLRRQVDAVDARVRRLALTPSGRALAEQTQKIQFEVVSAMVEHSSIAELAVIAEAMQRACRALEGLRDRG